MMEDVSINQHGEDSSFRDGDMRSSASLDSSDYRHGSSARSFTSAHTSGGMGSLSDSHGHHSHDSMAHRRRKRNLIIAGVVLLIVLVVAIPVAVTQNGSSSSNNKSTVGTLDPGTHPDPELFETLVFQFQDAGIDTEPLKYADSPQYRAYLWLASDENLRSYTDERTMQRYALAVFFYATNAVETLYTGDSPPSWVNPEGWLSQDHECSTWHGVQCDELDFVVGINLEENQLTGGLPMELAFLTKIASLDLTTNILYMQGQPLDVFGKLTTLKELLIDDNFIVTDNGLPSSLSLLTGLEKLRLSYNLLNGKLDSGVLDNLGQLTHLEVESNFLEGAIPEVVGTMSNLVYMYMRRNALESSLDFLKAGKMESLFALWLDSQNITGTLPTQMGQLKDLASLSITNSLLEGQIPSELGNLLGLRRVWFYANNLSGTIPTNLARLTQLEVFEVQANNIGGQMPLGVCAAVAASTYTSKSLASDCAEINCTNCCTECFPKSQ